MSSLTHTPIPSTDDANSTENFLPREGLRTKKNLKLLPINFDDNKENVVPTNTNMIDTVEDNNKEYTVEILINKTFQSDIADEMYYIADDVLKEIKIATKPIDISGKSRQPVVQELLFTKKNGDIEKIKVSVPKSEIYEVKDNPSLLLKKMTISKRCLTKNASKFLIIREITFQKYARKVSGECGIYVPQIISTQFYEDSTGFVCEVVMEKILPIPLTELNNLSPDEKIELFRKTKNALDCLRKHLIYHNDTHSNNVLFRRSENGTGIEPCLIDFGKANTEMSQPSSTGINVSNENTEMSQPSTTGINVSNETLLLDEFNTWINPELRAKLSKEQLVDSQFHEKYGGRTKKRNNNKKKKNTKKKSKTVKRMNTRRHRRKTRRG